MKHLNKWLAFIAMSLLMATPWATLRAQQLDVGVQNRSGVQHNVNAKTGTTTVAQKPTTEQKPAAVNPKILQLPPKDFVPKVRWHYSNLERHWEKHKA